uniref:Uncharacterized protein n=1 Tax=Methanococcus maripaludis (strain C6 / ATCC BAA-1332) TaxID=444158 RepID=A9A6F0_METM6
MLENTPKFLVNVPGENNKIIQIENLETLNVRIESLVPKREKRFKLSPNSEKFERARKKSELFKKFTSEELFPDDFFKLKSHNSLKTNEPDYLIKNKKTGKEFFIKCKFRTYLYKGMFDWSSKDQLNTYRSFENKEKIPVYFAFGLGGCANDPDHSFIMPLKKIKYCRLYPFVLKDWKISTLSDVFKIING